MVLVGLIACDDLSQVGSAPETKGERNSSSQTRTDGDGSSNQEPIVLSAKELVDKYWENKLRFKRDYSGKWVKLTGTVRYVTEDSIGLDEIGSSFSPLQALPPQPGMPDLVMEATVGKQISVTCLLDESGMVRDYYMLKGCHIQ